MLTKRAGRRENVRVVVLAREPGEFGVPGERRPDAPHLVRGHHHSLTRPAHEHSPLHLPVRHGARGRRGVVRVVHGSQAVRAEVDDVVPRLGQMFLYRFLQLIARVVSRNGDSHRTSSPASFMIDGSAVLRNPSIISKTDS